MPLRLKSKVAIISGGATGVGMLTGCARVSTEDQHLELQIKVVI